MSSDTSSSPEREEKEELKPAEEFISLDAEGDDFVGIDAASDASDDASDASGDQDSTFHPHRIDLETFRRLLACYPSTVEQVHRRKMMLKLQPKPAKGSKRKQEKKAGSASANMRGAALIQKTDFSPSEEKHIRVETEKFLKLDQWRYEEMPALLVERKEKGEKGGVSLTKDELITVMDWKTKHGLPRPTLMGMVKSNQTKQITAATSAGLAALPSADPLQEPDQAFPKPSMDALDKLRGIGPATSSLILSIATGADKTNHQVPFYSDDAYLWLCLKDFPEPETEGTEQLISGANANATSKPAKKVSKYKRPNGELNVKYNISEYRKLWNESWSLWQRLNQAAKEEEDADSSSPSTVSHVDIEKVAYVLRNIAVSGFYEDVDPAEILRVHAEQVERGIAHDQARKAAKAISGGLDKADEKKAAKKRKRQDEKSEKKSSSGSRNSKKKKT